MSESRWRSSECKGGGGLTLGALLGLSVLTLFFFGVLSVRDARMLAAVECLSLGQSPAAVIATPIGLRDVFQPDKFADRLPRCKAPAAVEAAELETDDVD